MPTNAARPATEDRLEVLQACPLAGSAAAKKTRRFALALETSIEAINNHAAPRRPPSATKLGPAVIGYGISTVPPRAFAPPP
jgi:hypothetical protein